MDWRRAKSVLILAFLLLNMVLGYQLWMEWRERISSAVDWKSLPSDALQVMQQKGIRVETQIPTNTPKLHDLTYKLEVSPRAGTNEKTAVNPPKETRIVFNEKELLAALGGVIPGLANYRFDNAASTAGTFVFNRMVDGLPLFDAQVKLYYSEQKIQAFHQDVIEPLPSEGGPEQKVLPATQALAKVIKQFLPAGSAVKEIQLGYHGQILFDSETQVSAPSWRVLLEDGEVYYVNAISAEVSTDKADDQRGRAS